MLVLERVSFQSRETFSRNSNGVRAINGSAASALTPLELRLSLIQAGQSRLKRVPIQLAAEGGHELPAIATRKELSGSKLPQP
jgi:hypothetical protein